MTICPARVVVTVELRPDASSATANSSEASSRPSNGESSAWACSISTTSVCPLRWNTLAATIRIAALTSSARVSARLLSATAQRSAWRLPARLRG